MSCWHREGDLRDKRFDRKKSEKDEEIFEEKLEA
jgi:hypothetical protein